MASQRGPEKPTVLPQGMQRILPASQRMFRKAIFDAVSNPLNNSGSIRSQNHMRSLSEGSGGRSYMREKITSHEILPEIQEKEGRRSYPYDSSGITVFKGYPQMQINDGGYNVLPTVASNSSGNSSPLNCEGKQELHKMVGVQKTNPAVLTFKNEEVDPRHYYQWDYISSPKAPHEFNWHVSNNATIEENSDVQTHDYCNTLSTVVSNESSNSSLERYEPPKFINVPPISPFVSTFNKEESSVNYFESYITPPKTSYELKRHHSSPSLKSVIVSKGMQVTASHDINCLSNTVINESSISDENKFNLKSSNENEQQKFKDECFSGYEHVLSSDLFQENNLLEVPKNFGVKSSASQDLQKSSKALDNASSGATPLRIKNIGNFYEESTDKFHKDIWTSSFSTPTSTQSRSEINLRYRDKDSPSSLKRSYSSTFSPKEDRNNFTPRREADKLSNLRIRGSTPRIKQRNYEDNWRRRSYPLYKSHSSQNSTRSSYDRKCVSDQTPYSEKQDYSTKRIRTNLPRYTHLLHQVKSDIGFIDSHCHLDFLFQRQNYDGTYSEFQSKHKDTFHECYEGCVAVFCNPFTFSQKSEWEKYLKEDNVWAAFGCHPHNSKDYNEEIEKSLIIALEHPRVRALGEIGLDYSSRNYCMKEVQHLVFKRQLKIAKKRELPLVIHCREAHDDCLKIMKDVIPRDYFIHLHCFTDTWDWAKKWLDAYPNLFIGITNVVTFPSAESVHEVAKNIPIDRLLLETDAPYFLPRLVSKSLRWSHPGLAIHVAAQIAALKEDSLDKILHSVRQNTKKMYNI